MTARQKQKWTEAKIRALGVLSDLPTVGSIFGMSETAAREAHAADRFPVPVLRVGRRWVVPVQPVLELLGYGGPVVRREAVDQRRGSAGGPPGPDTPTARSVPPDRAAVS